MAKRKSDLSTSEYNIYKQVANIHFIPKNEEQKKLIRSIDCNSITFVQGYPGTGKSYVSVSYALQMLFRDKYEKIIFTRPAVTASNEQLGHLPGELSEKYKPYMMPMFSIASQLIDIEIFKKLTNGNGHDAKIQMLPLAYMRGLSFKNSIVIFDEAQNSSIEQMRLFLTRISEESKLIICGDTRQSDIRGTNGLTNAFEILQNIPSIGFVTMSEKSIVRHPIIEAIENRYIKLSENSRKV